MGRGYEYIIMFLDVNAVQFLPEILNIVFTIKKFIYSFEVTENGTSTPYFYLECDDCVFT